MTDRYFLGFEGIEQMHEVTKDRYVRAERSAGYHNTLGKPDEPATGGFSNGSIKGSLAYGGRNLPKDFVPLPEEAKEEALKPLPPRVERLNDRPDSPVVFSFPKGSYASLDDTDGHLTLTLSDEHWRVWSRSISEHIGEKIISAAKGLFRR